MKKKLTRSELMMQTRQQILDTASDLFMSKGYLATSTRDIAKACNLTQPSLYHHFKDKETLYVAVVQELTKDVKTDLDHILSQDQAAEQILKTMIMTLIVSHPTNIFMMVNDIMTEMNPENKALMMVLWQETYLDRFSHFIEIALVQNETFQCSDPNAAGRYILSAISPLFNLNLGSRATENLEALVNQTVHFILYGIFQ